MATVRVIETSEDLPAGRKSEFFRVDVIEAGRWQLGVDIAKPADGRTIAHALKQFGTAILQREDG